MGITVDVGFINEYGEPVEESGKIHVTQNANALVCWTGTNKWITFSAQSYVSFNLNNIGCNAFGCCGDYHITVYLSNGKNYSFQVTKEFNDNTYSETIEIQTNGQVNGGGGVGNIGVTIEDALSTFASDVWIVVILIFVIAIILSVGWALGQFSLAKVRVE
ncbi:MAG: hypothetical protein QW478_04160 [Candidatus Micrarchaeaceae archaeon]